MSKTLPQGYTWVTRDVASYYPPSLVHWEASTPAVPRWAQAVVRALYLRLISEDSAEHFGQQQWISGTEQWQQEQRVHLRMLEEGPKAFEVGEQDWRPDSLLPEDYYAGNAPTRRANPLDAELRDLERRWQQTGDLALGERLVRKLHLAGEQERSLAVARALGGWRGAWKRGYRDGYAAFVPGTLRSYAPGDSYEAFADEYRAAFDWGWDKAREERDKREASPRANPVLTSAEDWCPYDTPRYHRTGDPRITHATCPRPFGRRGLLHVLNYLGDEGTPAASLVLEAAPARGRPGWVNETAHIAEVFTAPSARRRGYARALLAYARTRFRAVRHSSDLTGEGRAWSRAVGNPGVTR